MPSAPLVPLALCLLLQIIVCCNLPEGMNRQQLKQHCPAKCRCRCHNNLSQVRCRQIPLFPASGMTYSTVSLTPPSLKAIPQNAFKNMRASLLDLHGNMLTGRVHDDAFLGLDMLQVLILSDCRLNSSPVALSQLQNLEVLRLEYNNISVLTANSFLRNVNLVDLSLYRNEIKLIQPGAFAGLEKLRMLKLFGNKIHRIRRKQLRGLKALRSLDLSRNFIKQLPGKLFKDLKHLTWLDLESNLLTSVSQNTLKGLRRLKYLNLARNPLTQIADNSFTVVQRLRFLSLEVGNVASLSNSTFNGLKQLITLQLGEAQHQTFPIGFLGEMGGLKRLSVSNYKGTFGGFQSKMFPSDYNYSKLSIWNVPMDGCSCKTRWIKKMTKKSAYVFGYCRNDQPLACKRTPRS